MFEYLEIFHNRRRRQRPRNAHPDRVGDHEPSHPRRMRFQHPDSMKHGAPQTLHQSLAVHPPNQAARTKARLKATM